MRSVICIILLIFSSSCFASSIADTTTLILGIDSDQATISGAETSYSYSFPSYFAGVEIPMSKSSILVGVKTASASYGGITSSATKLSVALKFELQQ